MYVDNILLTLQNPESSLIHTLELTKSFTRLSGYKIKFEAMSLNKHCNKECLRKLPFKWSPDGIKELGVILKSELEIIVSINMTNILKNIAEDLDRWNDLPLLL